MNRPLCASMVAVLFLTVGGATRADDGGAPRGYIFFAPRNRPSVTAKARASSTKPAQKSSHADFKKPAANTAGHPSQVTAAPMPIPTPAADPKVSQVTWGTIYGEGYMYPGPGPVGSYGTPTRTPLHGWRSTYNWGGQTYSMHCYCAKGYCDPHCSGYRGECYRPCWNDAGQYGFEYNCRRGSPLDCLWHRGGYECPARCTDCPYVCGTPQWSSYGFPPQAYGAPTQGKGKPQLYYLPEGTSEPTLVPLSKPFPVPSGPTLPSNPPEPGLTDPIPMPEPEA